MLFIVKRIRPTAKIPFTSLYEKGKCVETKKGEESTKIKGVFMLAKKNGNTKQKGKHSSPKQKTSGSQNGSNGYH
jgi:hypothetical protein